MPRWDTYTDPGYQGKRLILPMGGPAADWATPDEIRHIQGLYAGEAAFVDHCLGRLFGALRDLGYYDDSVIFLTADHGHPLADHGKFLKGGDRMYSELLKVPYMIRLPGGAGARRTDAIVQFHDTLPTLLDLLGMGNDTAAMHGRSFAPVLRGESDDHRAAMITGYHAAVDRCVRDKTWSYVLRPAGEPDELYNLIEDPRERTNLIDDHPQEARRLAAAFGSYFRQGGAPVEVKGIQGRYEMASGSVA
jgi:arylsulfatase A-like enzyme